VAVMYTRASNASNLYAGYSLMRSTKDAAGHLVDYSYSYFGKYSK
jgi:hypothetical protein